jgi:hypothetical protein
MSSLPLEYQILSKRHAEKWETVLLKNGVFERAWVQKDTADLIDDLMGAVDFTDVENSPEGTHMRVQINFAPPPSEA